MENRPERRIVLAEKMIGQITIPLPPNPRTWWENSKSRVSPEGLFISGVISNVSWVTMWPAQTALSPLIHEIPWDRPEFIAARAAAGAFLIGAAAKSVALETRVFKEKKFSISPPGTIAYVGTGRARLTSIGEHAFDHALLSSANPFFVAGMIHNDPRLMVDSFIATSASLSTWNIFWNRMIVSGKIDPVTNRIKKAKEWARDKIIGSIDQQADTFTLASVGILTPGVWVELPRRKNNQQD